MARFALSPKLTARAASAVLSASLLLGGCNVRPSPPPASETPPAESRQPERPRSAAMQLRSVEIG